MAAMTDPGFAQLCSSLFGDLVDPDALWQVAKMSPDAADLHVPTVPARRGRRPAQPGGSVIIRKRTTPEERARRERLEARVGLASNYVGLAAGTAGTVAAARQKALKDPVPEHAGPLTSRVLHRVKTPQGRARLIRGGAAAALGLQVANVGGDVVANRVLGRAAHKDKVGKAVPLKRLVAGVRSQRRQLTRTLNGVGQAPAAAKAPLTTAGLAKPIAAGKQARAGFDAGAKATVGGVKQLAGSTGGQAALAGTAGVAGVAGYNASAHRRADDPYQFAAPYGKRDLELAGTFSKFDEDKRRAYGWASVVSVDGSPVIDRQGDFIDLDDIEEAAYVYVRKSRVAGDMHKRTADDQPHKIGELIESVVFTPDKCDAMGIPRSVSGRWWMGVQVEDDEAWQEVKKKGRTGFSIHGRGIRKDVSYDDLMAGLA